MKLNIKKLQTGGGVFFSAVADPSSLVAQQQTADITSSSKGSGILSDKVRDKLDGGEGLPNEVAYLNNIIAKMEENLDRGMPINRQALADVRSLSNRVIQQAHYLQKAQEFAANHESLDDIAIDQNGSGYIYAYNEKGKIQKISFNDFNPQKYQPVTIGELIEYRRNSPDAINNSDMIKTIGNSIGLEKINDFVQDILKQIGDTRTKEEAYASLKMLNVNPKQISEAEYNALKRLSEASDQIGMDQLFKFSETRKNSKVAQAISYIYAILPKNMKMQLQGTYIASGLEKSNNYALDLITMASEATSKNEYEFGINGTTSGSDGSGTSKGKSFYQTPNELLFDMDLNQQIIGISDPAFDNQIEIKVKGTKIPALTSDKGEAMYNLPLGFALDKTIGKYLNYDKIFMGEQKISEGLLNDIAYSRDNVAIVWMPIDNKNNIDWDGLHGCSAAEKEIKENQITAIEDKNKIHQKYHSFAAYNDNNELVPITITDRFMMTYGYTIDDIVDNDNKMAYELPGDEADEIDNLIDTIYNKNLKKNTGISGINKWITDDIYRIPIFIKVDQNASFDAYNYGGHGSLLPGQSLQQTQTQQESQKPIQSQDQIVYGNTARLF